MKVSAQSCREGPNAAGRVLGQRLEKGPGGPLRGREQVGRT